MPITNNRFENDCVIVISTVANYLITAREGLTVKFQSEGWNFCFMDELSLWTRCIKQKFSARSIEFYSKYHMIQPRSQDLFPGFGAGRRKALGLIGWSHDLRTPKYLGCTKLPYVKLELNGTFKTAQRAKFYIIFIFHHNFARMIKLRKEIFRTHGSRKRTCFVYWQLKV